MRLAFVVVAVLSHLLGAAPAARADVDPQRIDAAIARARDFLYKQQKDDNWESEDNFDNKHGDQKTGQTALVVYTLLAAGESPQDPRIVKAVEYLKKTQTSGVYALGMRCQVWLHLPQTPETQRLMEHDAKVLLNAVITQGEGRGFYAYNPTHKAWSHSRAQYAVLGLWAAAQSGIEIPSSYWRMVEQAWIEQQDPSGGWSYYARPDGQYPLTPGMTAVGVATLFITQEFLRANDAALTGGGERAIGNPAIERGMRWLIDNFDKVASDQRYTRDFPYSTIYAIERVGVASGLKYFGQIDWYEKGANWLLSKQYNNGAWPSEFGNVPSTCFAVLFLSRGRAPVAINKLDYTLPDQTPQKSAPPWNQRPRDVPNLTRFIAQQIEQDLKWQIVSLAAPFQDWLDAPILLMCGRTAIELDEPARQKIRHFIESGGLVLGNADGGSREFAASFTSLGQQLFAGYEFRELPADHVIYTNQPFSRGNWKTKPAVLGLSNGVRELMLLIPQADCSRRWQFRRVAGYEEHWQLPANIFLYCTDPKDLKTRGHSPIVARDPSIRAVRSIRLARLKYAGNWDPEPGGWRRLADLLHNRNRIDLRVEPVELPGGSLEGFEFAHLTGTEPIVLDDRARAMLRGFADRGGTIIIDAAGGSSRFVDSVEKELSATFGDAELKLLPTNHRIFTSGSAPMKQFAYRRYASRILGELKDQPRLRMIEMNGRAVVFFSREDLSAGLVGQSVDGVIGYEPATATELMSRILMYGR
ncbi:DUF4159 domain-containing protein [Fontivita pretiosa]|uniref:DUF4159 domain-containing protein n=1 Tax=Fontivita pretiosa TaxID=2989684 RepID=UPI003D17E78D